MTKNLMKSFALSLAGVLLAGSAFASEGGAVLQSGVDMTDKGSLQRGAQIFMNDCSGCHSLKYLRYSRMAADLNLTEDEVQNNLNLTGAKFGETIGTSMPAGPSQKWFGKTPPDLSLIARSRGADWVYTYLKSFYLDESRPLGWNNKLFPNASMPNPLFQEQGMQHAVYGPADKATGDKPVTGLKVTTPGTQNEAQFNQTVRDVTAFLQYAGEPAGIKRESLGVWVILFLAVLTFLAYLTKNEYWRDVEH